MNQIGEYIHLHGDNYLKYGISRNGQENYPSLSQVYAQQKIENIRKINSIPEIDKGTLEKLRMTIKSKMPESKDKLKADINDTKQRNQFGDYFLEQIQQAVPKADINQKAFAFIQSRFKEDSNIGIGITDVENAKKKRGNIYKAIGRLNENHSPKTLNTILKNFDDYLEYLGIILDKTGKFAPSPSENINMLDLASALQVIMSQISYAEAYKATKQGAWGEAVVAACADAALTTATGAVKEVIVGMEGSKFQVDPSMVSKEVAAIYQHKTGNNLFQVRKSQNKVDVQMKFNQQDIYASVKTYTSSNGVLRMHLQDINLFYSLATTVPYFANHWINLHSIKDKSLKDSGMDYALKQHMRYEALVSGNLLKQDATKANTFVAIDVASSNPEVYVLSTRELLSSLHKIPGAEIKLTPNIEDLKIEGNDKISSSTYQYVKYKKGKEEILETTGSATNQRIANIIASLRSIKINAAMTINFKNLTK